MYEVVLMGMMSMMSKPPTFSAILDSYLKVML
jgi:hypothetical protein